MYNPRNVAYKSTAHVYFLTKIKVRVTRIGEQKTAGGLKINAIMKRCNLVYIICEKSGWAG